LALIEKERKEKEEKEATALAEKTAKAAQVKSITTFFAKKDNQK
jgi:hypothetical protein